MKELSFTRLLARRLWEQKLVILFFFLFAFVCLLTTTLSALPIAPILYALFICTFLGCAFLLWDFYKYRASYQLLLTAHRNIDNCLSDLPTSSSLQERYALLVQEVFDSKIALSNEILQKTTEQNDYYSLWIHQIKTPISAMRLLLQSKSGILNPLLLEQELFKIEQYAHMALHYLRLQNFSSDLLLQECNLASLLRQSIKKFSVSFIEKKLSLELEDFNASIITDEKWLSFILEQILSNCLKYTHHGSIGISFNNDCYPRLIIKDTGIGIKEEDLPRIFEKGFTGFNGHMNKKSTGIGLYLCKQVAQHLQIALSVDSKINCGTTFTLQFKTLQK